MNRPHGIGYKQYPMEMVGHNHPFIQFDFISDFSGFDPFTIYDFPGIIQLHFPINDFPKQAFPVLSANGYKICPALE